DVEGAVWHNGKVYLFTRDRADHRLSTIYSLAADGPAQQKATRIGELQLDNEVTDAAIRPDGRQLVLLGRDRLFVCDVSGEFVPKLVRTISLGRVGQAEGAVYVDEGRVAIVNEKGKLYSVELR
ncbi:MAG TPA: hypothetical protein VEI97_12245, partial [bacterium]|nr:hypothetical protein [bacterium]